MSECDGRLTVDGDRAVLNFERRLPFPVEVVWSAITDPEEREQWFGVTTIEAREGGTIEMVATGPPLPPERKRMTGRILVWDPPHVLEHEWKQPIVEDGVVRYELTADGDGTLLRFTVLLMICSQVASSLCFACRRQPRDAVFSCGHSNFCVKCANDLSGKARPSEFKTKADTQLFLVTYKRGD